MGLLSLGNPPFPLDASLSDHDKGFAAALAAALVFIMSYELCQHTRRSQAS
jgi:hypothetical protein